MLDDLLFATDHLAIAALQTPHATAGTHIHVMQILRGEFFRTSNVIDVVRIAAIDHDVASVQLSRQLLQRGVHHRCRNH